MLTYKLFNINGNLIYHTDYNLISTQFFKKKNNRNCLITIDC